MPLPALLLHGFLGRGADWAPVAERLAETRRVLAPDWVDDADSDDVGAVPYFDGGSERSGSSVDRSESIAEVSRGIVEQSGSIAGQSRSIAGVSRSIVEQSGSVAGVSGGDAGQSGGDVEPFDVAAPRSGGLVWAADRLAARLDAAQIGRADVVGYSMGGRLALLFAVRHPARVGRLALVSASPGVKTPEERAARRAHDAALARALVADFPAFLHRWTRQPVFASLSDDQRAAIEADRAAHVDPERAARALVALGTGAMPSLWARLGGLPAETTAVVGELDPTYVALAHAMGNPVAVRVVPHAGHSLLAEAPGPLTDLLAHLLA